MMSDTIVLVDENDVAIGTGKKDEVHRTGQLHRAFSVFVFDASGRVLLQQRAKTKYHSAGLWSNTCCSHPRPGEPVTHAAQRRLQEEMGFTCPLRELFSFTYRTEFENDLVEHEYDHVLVGAFNGSPVVDPDEVEAWKWVDIDTLALELRSHPRRYTYWFKLGFQQLLKQRPEEMMAA